MPKFDIMLTATIDLNDAVLNEGDDVLDAGPITGRTAANVVRGLVDESFVTVKGVKVREIDG